MPHALKKNPILVEHAQSRMPLIGHTYSETDVDDERRATGDV